MSFQKASTHEWLAVKLTVEYQGVLVTPLIKALKKTVGHCEYLDYMDSFYIRWRGSFHFDAMS